MIKLLKKMFVQKLKDNCFFPEDGVSKTGFTLVEALIATAILLISITGPLSIVAQSLHSANFARDQITAYYLAQEAMEIIRNQRDSNTLAAVGWDNGLSNCKETGLGERCFVDATENPRVFSSCPSGVCPILEQETASGLFGYGFPGSSVDTQFVRTISINDIDTQEVSIAVTVDWVTGVVPHSVSLKENLLAWQ